MYDSHKVINLFGEDSYRNKYPQLKIASEEAGFVEMLMYDIVIPVKGRIPDNFNMFERAVIKLAKIGISTPERISETMCIPLEMAKFIVSRLKDLEILDDSGFLSKRGEIYLANRGSADSVETMSAVVFALKSTGQFLPIVLTSDEVNYVNADIGKKQIIAHIGTAGNEQRIKGYVFGADEQTNAKRSQPTQKELRMVLDNYNNLMHSMHRPKIAFYRDRMIECSYSPTHVLLLVKAALQRGNRDSLLCSEGMLINNDIIGKALNTDYELKQRLTSAAAVTERTDGSSEAAPIRRYEEILRNMPAPLRDVQSVDEQKENESIIKDNIPKIFAMLEHAFHYYITINTPPEGVIQMFRTQDKTANEGVLAEYLWQMGADIEKCNTRVISGIDKPILKRYIETGVPHIYSVVPLAIAEAYGNPTSTVRKMITAYPRFVDYLGRLTMYAGEFRHGGQKFKVSESKHDNLFYTAKKMISCLLPDIEWDAEKNAQTDSLFDVKVKAVSAVSNDIGAVCYYTLDSEIRNELLKTSSDKSDNELPLPSEAVMSFSRIAERLLKRECDKFSGGSGSSREDAIARLKKYTNDDVPEGLLRVAEKNVFGALAGNRSTLGGYTLAYILKAEDESVRGFIKKDFHRLVCELAEYRGHGNNAMLSLSVTKLKQLRSRTYDLIQYLGGNYDA